MISNVFKGSHVPSLIGLHSRRGLQDRLYSKIRAASPTAIGVEYEVPLKVLAFIIALSEEEVGSGSGPCRSSPIVQKLSLSSKCGGLKPDHLYFEQCELIQNTPHGMLAGKVIGYSEVYALSFDAAAKTSIPFALAVRIDCLIPSTLSTNPKDMQMISTSSSMASSIAYIL